MNKPTELAAIRDALFKLERLIECSDRRTK